MAQLGIRARFPSGVFLGHRDQGRLADSPDTARLFSALVHAAGKGSTAVEAHGDLRPAEASRQALLWLESHPPTALSLPATKRLHQRPARVYRDEGVLEKSMNSRKVGKGQSEGVAVFEPFGWAWDEEVPDDIVATLEVLCADVSCLGDAESPVILEIGDISPTHLLVSELSPFARIRGGVKQRTPARGRLAALDLEYEASRPGRAPSVAQDRAGFSQLPTSATPTIAGLEERGYRPIVAPPPELPWGLAWAFQPSRRIQLKDRLTWCVALHRTLAARLGDMAPPIITGTYPSGVTRPANRVAIHYVEGPTQDDALRAGSFLVLAPAESAAEELAALESALGQLRRLYAGSRGEVDLTPLGQVDPLEFWLPPLPGAVRRWRPTPALVPEIRQQQGGKPWSLEDSVLVAVGHVFRDRLVLGKERGEARYRDILRQVRSWGVRVSDVHRIGDSKIEKYVHRLSADLVAQPLTATLDLSRIVPASALLALGQSRHLGGGLLQPVDLASESEG